VVQMFPLPFCFISITTRPTWACPGSRATRSRSHQLRAHIGGSILIAITNAQVTSRSMWHEQASSAVVRAGTPGFDQHVKALAGVLGNSFGAANANRMALAQIYHQLTQQAQTQGYQDVYMELSWASDVLVALALC